MGNINPIFNDRVRYTLKSKDLESLIVTEPIGWNDDEKEFSRHEQYHGIIAKFSNSLKFIDSGADYIQLILDIYGINEQVELIREEKHPQTDVWTLTYSGYLDLSTWSRENNQVSVKFNSGGLEQLLKSREGEKVELDRLTTIDGKVIPPINTIDVELEGRRIFLKSQLEAKAPDNYISLSIYSNGNTRNQTGGVPLKIINKSHEELSFVPNQSTANEDQGTTNMMFFLVSEVDRVLDVKLNFTFRTNVTQDDDINHGYYWFSLTKYKDGSAFNVKNRITLFGANALAGNVELGGNAYGNSGFTHSVNWAGAITLLQGESLGMEVLIHADMGGNWSRGHWDVTTDSIVGKITIDEDSKQEKTNTKALLVHEIGERLVSIATNKQGAFYSDFLGRTDIGYPIDGKASLTGCTHGFWVRGFDKLPIPTEGPPKVENMFKPLTTSFKDYVASLSAVWNVGIGIEKIGFSERVRMEELSYFYNRNVTIKLPNQIKNVKRNIAVEKYYSALEFGYVEGGNYEEACGLDEYNAKSNFTTVINRLKNTYTKTSEYRADSYGMEFTRRKQKSLNDTEDTGRDNSIWFLDLKRGVTSLFKQRKWQDDFEVEPTGVFSPETATNLRFSPINCLLRHSWWFSGGFKKYASDYVRYGSSTANSQLKTKLRTDATYANNLSNTPGNGNEYAENGNIINSEIAAPRFLPEEIEFEHVCDFDVMQQVNGFTTILGKRIPNFYGLVEFINERNEIEKGFLFNLKPNGKGQWKVLKANR